MERIDIYRNIEEKFYQSVVAPVNPFSVDNPDVLVYNGRNLIGLYVPYAKEINNPDLLLRRLFISRLILCNSVSNVLLLDQESGLTLSSKDQVMAAFDAVLPYSNIQDITLFLGDNIRIKHKINPRLKREKFRRYWGTMDFMNKYGFENNGFVGWDNKVGYKVQSWCEPNKMQVSKSARFEYPFMMATKRSTKQSFMEGFDSLMTYTAMFCYSLDDGLFRSKSEAEDSFMFLNLEDLASFTKNPMNLKTMVFLGYLPGRINDNYNIQGLMERYRSFMREKKYI